MRRSTRFDIVVLLGFLLVFSSGIGILHGGLTAAATNDDQERWEQLAPLAMSRDIKNMARIITRLSFDQQKRLLHRIILDKDIALKDKDKIELLFLVVAKRGDASQRRELLDMLASSMPAIAQQPLFYDALEVNSGIIPILKEWIGADAQKINEWARIAAQHAINNDNPGIIKKFFEYQVALGSADATSLLWDALGKKKNPEFIALLIQAGASPNDARAGKTVLVAAVETGQEAAVKELLDHGADINLIKDPAVGSALQMAVKKGLSNIDVLLRSRGARE